MIPAIFTQYYSWLAAPRKHWYESALRRPEFRLFVILDFKNAMFDHQSCLLITKFFDGKRDILPLFICYQPKKDFG
jgi:hypothetical protein